MNDTSNTTIDLLRHGEPLGGRKFRGHSIDDPLSDKGWSQMRNAIGSHCPWNAIVSSPMKRCVEFATEVSLQHDLPLEIEPELREVGFGSWEGHTPDEVRLEFPEAYTSFYADPVNCRPAGAEPLTEFIERTVKAYESVVDRHQGKHVLLVSHAGVMRSIIAHTLHAAPIGLYRIKVENAGISRIVHTSRGAMLSLHNATLT
jgi:probable phosphoglycerate mutase